MVICPTASSKFRADCNSSIRKGFFSSLYLVNLHGSLRSSRMILSNDPIVRGGEKNDMISVSESYIRLGLFLL
jgi:hypothetical protein